MKTKMKNIKNKWAVAYATALMMAGSNAPLYASELGAKTEGLANTVQEEALGILEVVGLIGIVVAAVCVFINKRDVALKVAIGTIAGYLILKYASPIWEVIKSGL